MKKALLHRIVCLALRERAAGDFELAQWLLAQLRTPAQPSAPPPVEKEQAHAAAFVEFLKLFR